MAKAIRDVYGETLKKYGAMNENIVVLDADVSGSTKSAIFGKEYPDRFYNCGISEYAMMGMAAGMAKNGQDPVCQYLCGIFNHTGVSGSKNLYVLLQTADQDDGQATADYPMPLTARLTMLWRTLP